MRGASRRQIRRPLSCRLGSRARHSNRGSSLIAVLAVAVILMVLLASLLTSSQGTEISSLNSAIRADLRLATEASLAIQAAALVTNNDHRSQQLEFEATRQSLGADVERIPLRQRLEAAAVDVNSDAPCNLCGINNEMIYAGALPARNVVYQQAVCASRRAQVGSLPELGRSCRQSEVNLFPWANDGRARAQTQDTVSFPLE